MTSGEKRRTPAGPSKRKAPETAGPDEDPAVTELLRSSDHPLRAEIEAVRRIVRGASPEIREGVKWNAPSFRTKEWFATLNNPNSPRGRDSVQLVLHAGAKAKDVVARGRVPDPSGLLRWLADDRCLVTFDDGADIDAKRAALEDVVRAWIRLL